MSVSSTAAREPGTVLTGAQREPAQVEPLSAQQSQEGTQPHSLSQTHVQVICPLCPRKKTYQGTAASVAAHQREVRPGKGNSLLGKFRKPLQKTHCSSGCYLGCLLDSNMRTSWPRYIYVTRYSTRDWCNITLSSFDTEVYAPLWSELSTVPRNLFVSSSHHEYDLIE